MSRNAARQRGHDPTPVGRQPAFTPIAHRMRAKHQILHYEAFITLEPRTRRDRGLDDLLLVNDPLGRLAAAATRRALELRTARLLHAARLAGLDVRPALQALEPRDLLALFD